jgi:arylsulfatase A-like enzyme
MSPWNIRNTGLAWGADFKQGLTVRTPTGNVDLVPTILSLLDVATADGFDGRVLAEAIEGGPDPEQMVVETRIHMVERAEYAAALQMSTVGGHRYVDKSWRIA